jgi:hypothetical protein
LRDRDLRLERHAVAGDDLAFGRQVEVAGPAIADRAVGLVTWKKPSPSIAMSSGLSVVLSAPWVLMRAVPVMLTPEPSDRPTAYLFSAEAGEPGIVIV